MQAGGPRAILGTADAEALMSAIRMLGSPDRSDGLRALELATALLGRNNLRWEDVVTLPTGRRDAKQGEGAMPPRRSLRYASGADIPEDVRGRPAIARRARTRAGSPMLVITVQDSQGGVSTTYGPLSVFDGPTIMRIESACNGNAVAGRVRQPPAAGAGAQDQILPVFSIG